MNKDTIELERDESALYINAAPFFTFEGVVKDEAPYLSKAMDALVNWSMGKNVKIYKHLIRVHYEDILRSFGTKVVSLDIYWQ